MARSSAYGRCNNHARSGHCRQYRCGRWVLRLRLRLQLAALLFRLERFPSLLKQLRSAFVLALAQLQLLP
jgi:hypothetical protein